MLAFNEKVARHYSSVLILQSKLACGPNPDSNLYLYGLRAKNFYIFKGLLKNKNKKRIFKRLTHKAQNIYDLALYRKSFPALAPRTFSEVCWLPQSIF